MPSVLRAALAALALAAWPAAAAEAPVVNAHGAAAFGRSDGNAFGPATEDGSYESVKLSLGAAGRPTEQLLLGTLIEVEDGEVDVEWAFGEWRFSELLKVRLGKAKHPFGIYTEIEDVGTLRPFYDLPAAVYGGSGIAAESYIGAGLTGRAATGGGWSLEWDAYGGALEIAELEPAAGAVEEEAPLHDVIGARLALGAPLDGLQARASAYTGRHEEESGEVARHTVYGLALEYLTDALSLRAEGYRFADGEELTGLSGYLEAAHMIGPHLQVAARVEASRTELDGFAGPDSLLEHREAALGLNYWFSPAFVLKASFHLVDGNRFALPEAWDGVAPLDSRTNTFVVGAQFSL